jgi:hypothetical protein
MFLFLEVIVATYESLIHLSLSMNMDNFIFLPLALCLIIYLASIPFTAQMATSKVRGRRLFCKQTHLDGIIVVFYFYTDRGGFLSIFNRFENEGKHGKA